MRLFKWVLTVAALAALFTVSMLLPGVPGLSPDPAAPAAPAVSGSRAQVALPPAPASQALMPAPGRAEAAPALGPLPPATAPLPPAPAPLPPAPLPPAPAPLPPAPQPPATAPLPAAPPPAPAGPWAGLDAAVTRAAADFPGTYAVAVVDLQTGARWERNAGQEFHPASTIKMPVTLFALHEYRAGRLNWSDTIEYQAGDYESPGGGALETAPFGGWYSVENLVGRALRYSNNIAVNMLGRHLGWDRLRAFTRDIDGELRRGPAITAHSAAGWWLHLWQLMQAHPEDANLLVKPLQEVAYRGRIPAGLPQGTPHLHKFGSYAPNFHDTGIVFGSRPYVIVVLTSDGTEDQADAVIAAISGAVWQHVQAR